MGRPHKRLMWLDIESPEHPVLVWQEGDAKNPAKVKDKDRMPLIEIVDIKAGQASAVLQRSGKREDADRYMSFAADNRTLDVEAPTVEGRDWLFKKFADLFQAYATAQMEHLHGDDVTLRVADIIDNGVPGGDSSAGAGAGGGGGGGGDGGSMRGGPDMDMGSPRGRGRSPARASMDASGAHWGGGGGGGSGGYGGGGGGGGMGGSGRYGGGSPSRGGYVGGGGGGGYGGGGGGGYGGGGAGGGYGGGPATSPYGRY